MNSTGTILIVDDEAAVLHFFQKALRRAGFQVTSAASGEAALKWIAQQEFDLALLDLQLQSMSGLDVMEQLQQQWPATPVIIITAHASLDTAVKALRQGAHDYLIKPCSIDELLNSARAGMLRRQHDLARRPIAVFSQSESTDTPRPKTRSTQWSAVSSSAGQPALPTVRINSCGLKTCWSTASDMSLVSVTPRSTSARSSSACWPTSPANHRASFQPKNWPARFGGRLMYLVKLLIPCGRTSIISG